MRTAREHFAAKGMHVDLIKLYGSMELAPLAGLADVIVDLVSTGRTLKANDLVAVEEIMLISARLIVNPGALKLKRDLAKPLIDALADASRDGAPGGWPAVTTAATARRAAVRCRHPRPRGRSTLRRLDTARRRASRPRSTR